ncbi:MAG: M20/M25/M40 family metallo-hydrolase [Pyrinomonadaceae bacterium]
MRKFLTILISLALLSGVAAPALRAQQPSAEVRQASVRLAGSILVGGRAYDYLQSLTDKFGGRLSGSTSYQRSAEWAAAEFRAMGVSDVRLEPFTLESTWTRGAARGRILSPVERTLHVESLGWAPSTPAGGVRGEVVRVGDLTERNLRAMKDKLRGRVVMIDTRSLPRGIEAFVQLIASQKLFQEAGAAAVLIPDRESNNAFNAFNLNWGARLSPLPFAHVGMEDAELIARLAEKGQPVEVEFEYQNRTGGAAQTANVVAEIRGRERPDEWIIVGAHLDSWDFGTGAQDNGSGCAMVLEAARAIMSLGQPPRRSIRFALWGGEEQGLIGSRAYVEAHERELKNCVAVLNTDNGAGHPKGWKVEGREDVSKAMQPISKSLLEDLSGGGLSPEASFDTDHGFFMLRGIPALDLWVDMEPYGKIHHKSSDTLDKLDRHSLAGGSAIVAVTAYALAERAERLAPQLERKAVGELLQKANMIEMLKAFGFWK